MKSLYLSGFIRFLSGTSGVFRLLQVLVSPYIAHRPNSLEMVRSMVGHGLGYTVLATKPASAMSYDGKSLVTRPYLGGNDPMRVVIAARKGTSVSPAVEKFLLF